MLKKLITLTTVSISLLASPTHADSTINFQQDCNTAVKYINGDHSVNREDVERCIAYVEGVKSTLFLLNTPEIQSQYDFCWPEGGMPINETVVIVTNYLNDNPEELTASKNYLTFKALQQAYPCTENS